MGRSKLFSSLKLISYIQKPNVRYCSCVPAKEDACAKDGSRTRSSAKKGLVLGVYQGEDKVELSPDAADFDQKFGGKIGKHLNEVSSVLKLGKAFLMTDVDSDYSAIALTSLGPRAPGYNDCEALDETRENARIGVGAGVSLLEQLGCDHVVVDRTDAPDAAAEAAHLAAWRFDEFKTEGEHKQPEVVPYSAVGSWDTGAVLGRCQNWARFLSDMPANKMTPMDFAQECLNVLCPLGVRVLAHERSWIEAQGMKAFLAVAQGSCTPPMMLQLEYTADSAPPTLLTAKGTTYDSGGLCLKSHEDMVQARGCMAGAAVVVAAIRACAELKARVNLRALIPLCENMISGQCMKVGDVVTALNGLSIQIEDTDNEGRLMLADALVYGQALYKPRMLLDVATLTRGMQLATGEGAFGVFVNSPGPWAGIRRAGAATGDRPWLFPTWHFFEKRITDDPAVDLRNRGSGKASACKAAAFLKKFVCTDWMHMDVSGVGRMARNAPPYLRPGRMSGRPTRTLASYLMHAGEQPEQQPAPV
ncbi:cytosol aminopeptidase-like [Aricia agestis]|uniref:cytosol aminopeptidase-like n=1 Tax=Aricia agestis TaxID=91739 RepID=UPI001C20A51A|nr:cytosol aminopeptidase-like [Aricia agestis]